MKVKLSEEIVFILKNQFPEINIDYSTLYAVIIGPQTCECVHKLFMRWDFSMGLESEMRSNTMLKDEPSERIDPRALKAWFFGGILEGLVLLLIPVAYLLFKDRLWELPDMWGWAAIGAVTIYTIWDSIIAPQLRIRFWRYEIREDEIDIQHGIFIIRRTLIPMIRVQHVDTEYGPVMRYFGLATLRISTAATDHRIPALSKEKASELMGEIAALARVSDEDV